ncbi:MAG: M48 family metallopeptidase [archaeon]
MAITKASVNSRVSFQDQISGNKWKSFFLMAIILVVFVLIGAVIGMIYQADFFIIMIIAIIISVLYLWISYYNSDKIALASVGAKEAPNSGNFRQYHIVVDNMAIASGLPKPRVYYMNDSQINAFASGRNPEHAVICVTTGTLEKLNKQELEGVIGHEMSHIANYDIRFMTLAAVMVGMIAIVSEIFLRSLWFKGGGSSGNSDSKGNAALMIIGIALAILAPIFVQLVQLAISRRREYVADANAVQFIRSPTGLVGALEKIKSEQVSGGVKKPIPKAVAPLFMADPFKTKVSGLFMTHPPLEKRIELLERM